MNTRRDFLQLLAAGIGLPDASAQAGLPTTYGELALEPTGSDVGNLYPFIRAQQASLHGETPLSFLQARFTDIEVWRRQARKLTFDLLQYAPAKCNPHPEIVERRDCGDYVQEAVYFNTTPDIRVPAAVLIPKRLSKPAPALIALHDHGGYYYFGREKLLENPQEHESLTAFKKQYYAGKSIAAEAVRHGYVVIAIDMFYWGERRMLLDQDPNDWVSRPASITSERISEFNQRSGQQEQLVGRSIYTTGFTWPGVMCWDDIRTIDYLMSRPEVDPHRIGCVGLSVGGFRSCHLAALDDRIKASVVVGWMTSFPYQLKRKIVYTIGHSMLVPGLYRELDYPDVAAMAAPRPMLVINGSKDTLFEPDGVRAAFAKLNACYAKAGAANHVRTKMYDTPHEFNEEMQNEAWDWLKRWV